MKIILEKADTLNLKCFAIISIILHNLLHNIKKFPSQNEFNFSIEKFSSFVEIIINDHSDIYRSVLSYFGHYGVPIFVFLSAYGLTRKYQGDNLKYLEVVLPQIKKVYYPFVFTIIIWLSYDFILNNVSIVQNLSEYWEALFFKLAMINLPGYSLAPIGPWWFFPAILQLYIIFPVLISLKSKFSEFSLLIIGIVSLAVLIYINKKILFYNFIGHLPEFCLGIFCACGKAKKLNRFHLLLFVSLFLVGQLNVYFWFLSKLSFIVIVIYMYLLLKSRVNVNNKVFRLIGEVSLFAFLINGFIRTPFIVILKEVNNDFIIIIYSILYLMFVLGVSILTNWIFLKAKKLSCKFKM